MLELALVADFIKGQRIQWLCHTINRGENETVRILLEWKPQGKRPGGRPRKRFKNLNSWGLEWYSTT